MPPPSAPRVLVVDDDPAIRAWLRRSLEHAGYLVTTAHDIPAAETVLADGHLDAMIFELRLGGRSGVELLDLVRGHPRLASIPVLMLTGVARMSEVEELTIRRHSAHVFYKPAPVGDIVNTLNRLVAAP
jgi:two-component system, chemotaxis family, sensor kinase CheA